MTEILSFFAAIFAFALAVITMRSGLMRLVAPSYRRLGADYRDLLANPGLSTGDRAGLEFLCRNLFNGWIAWAVVFLVPIAIVMSLFDRTELTNLQTRTASVVGRSILGLMAQNPIAGFILLAEFILIAAPLEAIKKGVTSAAFEKGLSFKITRQIAYA